MMSSAGVFAARDMNEFVAIQRLTDRVILPGAQFPAWPFRFDFAFTSLWEFDVVRAGRFGGVLRMLAREFGDREIYVLTADPPPQSRDSAPDGVFFAYRLQVEALPDVYGSAMYAMPTGAYQAGDLVDKFAIVGSSGEWGIWSQRDWELGLVASTRSVDLGYLTEVRQIPSGADLEWYRGPEGWAVPLTMDAKESLFDAIDDHRPVK